MRTTDWTSVPLPVVAPRRTQSGLITYNNSGRDRRHRGMRGFAEELAAAAATAVTTTTAAATAGAPCTRTRGGLYSLMPAACTS